MTEINEPEIEKERVSLQVLNLEQDDFSEVEVGGTKKHILDIKALKKSRGAEFCMIEDLQSGLIVQCQSYKHPLKNVSNNALSLFKKIKAQRNISSKRNYIL